MSFLRFGLLLVSSWAINLGKADPTVFINEIHYDDIKSKDVDEAVEVAFPTGTDISSYRLEFYNGKNGKNYRTISLSNAIPGSDENGLSFAHVNVPGFHNGGPEGDGVALIDDTTNTIVQFLSYEGTITGRKGTTVAGMTSTDIGVWEKRTPVGHSLQLSGSGCTYSDFTWQMPRKETMGKVNTGQTIACRGNVPTPPPTISTSSPTPKQPLPRTPRPTRTAPTPIPSSPKQPIFDSPIGMFELFPGYNMTPMTELSMQYPMYHFSVPHATDWNQDGVLDLWHHNHYPYSGQKRRWSDPSTTQRGASSGRPGGCMVDWDAVLRNGQTGEYYPVNNGNGFIEWTDKKSDCFDVHSSSFLDLNNDGYRDLLLVTGGGRGNGKSYKYDNALFWGVKDPSSSLGYKLVGGREAALEAGLEGRSELGNERGRHLYVLDIDGDSSFLDIIFFNEERSDRNVVPGNLYRNLGNNKFARVDPKNSGFEEFAGMALLTDMDGDNMAKELLVPSACERRGKGSKQQENDVCNRAPKNTISIFQIDPRADTLMVRKKVIPKIIKRENVVNGLASGDFDFDGLADIAILWQKTISFHYSSSRQKKCSTISNVENRKECLLTLGQPDASIDLKNTCGRSGASNFRLADFDLNGMIDILVLCEDTGLHVLFELLPNGSWREMQNQNGKKRNLGELNSKELMSGGANFCDGVPLTGKQHGPTKTCADYFPQQRCKSVSNNQQFVICNNRNKGIYPAALGATVADIDNDGFADIIVGYKFGSMVMLRNTMSGRRFIAVRLDRTAGPAASIGAIVKATTTRMGPSQDETWIQVRVVSTLSHETDLHGGHEDRLIFGLGQAGELVKLTVHWPHCCNPTVLTSNQIKPVRFYNQMIKPYEVPAPVNCDKRCL